METKKIEHLHRLPHGLPADRYDGGRRGRLCHRQHTCPGAMPTPQGVTAPTRIVTSTVRVTGTLAMVSCKTAVTSPKARFLMWSAR